MKNLSASQKKQRGLTLTGVLVAAVILGIVGIIGTKVMADVVEFYAIRKAARVVTSDPNAKYASEADLKSAFSKYAEIDNIKSITPQDLTITRGNDQAIISFAYSKRVPLFSNVSLLIDFEGSSVKP